MPRRRLGRDCVLGHAKVAAAAAEDGLRGIPARIHEDVNENLDRVERREWTVSRMLLLADGEREDGKVETGAVRVDIRYRIENNAAAAVPPIAARAGGETIMSDVDLAELASYVLRTDDDDEDASERMLLESMPPRFLFEFERAQASAKDNSERMLLESCYLSSSARLWPPPREEGAGVRVPLRATSSGGRRCSGRTNVATPRPKRNVRRRRRRRRRRRPQAVTKNTFKILDENRSTIIGIRYHTLSTIE